MSVMNIDKNNFQAEVMNEEKTYCWISGPAGAALPDDAPVVEEIAAERPDIKVGKINVDEQPELAGQYRVMSIPTLLVMKGGKVVNQMVGARPKAQVLAMLEKA